MCVVVKIVCEQNLKTADIYCELRSIYRQNSSRKCSMSTVGVLYVQIFLNKFFVIFNIFTYAKYSENFVLKGSLFSDNRTYHFQAEDENDQRAWMSVLINCKESALYRAFDDGGKAAGGAAAANPSLLELQQAIVRHIQRLPSNDHCADCNSQNGMLCKNQPNN